jgi:DNA-binding GntR family transcriptional regulator
MSYVFQHVKGRPGQTGTDAPSPVPSRSAVSDERAVVDWLLCGRGLHILNLDPLPSEEDLRALLRAPRKAVRTALGNLASAGLIRRRRSLGTSVPGSHEKKLGVTWPGSRSYELIAVRQVAQQLLKINDDELVRIDRLTRDDDGMPLSLCSIYLPEAAHRQLGDAAWQLSSTEVAKKLAGGEVAGRYGINALPIDHESAALLDVPEGSPCLHVERVFTNGTKPVLVVFARTPGVRVAARMNVMPGDADF